LIRSEPMSANISLSDFIENLRAPSGAPGGGAASAAGASLGCALYQMVAGVTLSLPRFTEGRDQLEEIRIAASSLCDQLKELAEIDADAYRAVENAMKMPRATSDEKAARRKAMQEAFKNATSVPLQIMDKCLDALKLLPDLLQYGNPNAITDIAVGTLLLDAAIKGTSINAEINLSSIKDAGFVEEAKCRLVKGRQAASTALPLLKDSSKEAGITL
jgi:formiminotetrahydrofolate cyclodeaminase